MTTLSTPELTKLSEALDAALSNVPGTGYRAVSASWALGNGPLMSLTYSIGEEPDNADEDEDVDELRTYGMRNAAYLRPPRSDGGTP